MIKSLTRASLLALFSTSIFAAAAIAPPPVSADWIGEIAPAAEQPAGQAQASGFADEYGLISIPTPAQVGDTEEVIFLGNGTVSISVSNGINLIIDETLPLTRLELFIRASRASTSPFHSILVTRIDPTGTSEQQQFTAVAFLPEGGSASVEMTGTFDCSGTICDGRQEGTLSFRLEVLAPPE